MLRKPGGVVQALSGGPRGAFIGRVPALHSPGRSPGNSGGQGLHVLVPVARGQLLPTLSGLVIGHPVPVPVHAPVPLRCQVLQGGIGIVVHGGEHTVHGIGGAGLVVGEHLVGRHERVRVAVLELIGQIGEEVGDVNRAAHRFPHTHCAVESRSVSVGVRDRCSRRRGRSMRWCPWALPTAWARAANGRRTG